MTVINIQLFIDEDGVLGVRMPIVGDVFAQQVQACLTTMDVDVSRRLSLDSDQAGSQLTFESRSAPSAALGNRE